MALGRLWAGKVFGTSTGNLFVKIEGEDSALKGTLHHNESEVGIVVYEISGSFDGSRLSIEGTSQTQIERVKFGRLKATASLQPTGNLDGEWETDIGSAGTFELSPHDRSQAATSDVILPDQLHTARHNFGPIEIDRNQIIALADDIQRDFARGKVVVTFVTGTEQSRFLEDFKQLNISAGRAELVKLFVREPDISGMDRSVTVEFGQTANWVMCQGVRESWSLGELEKFKREIRKFERVYAAKKFGVGINQFMLVCTIVFLPSLTSLRDRAILMGGVLALAYSVNWLHSRYLPHAAIYLSKRKDGWLMRFLPSAASWLIGIAASVIATLLGAYLKGWLSPSLLE
ncbi:MAG: hypothetical protein ACT4SY_06465 [Hyphomicrobiales bacterium]